MVRAVVFTVMLGLASPALSQGTDDGFCRNGGFPSENKSLGVSIVTVGRAYLLKDMNGCPSAESQCRQRSYVVKGDEVLTGRMKGKYVCAYFPNSGGGSAGWVDMAQLKVLPIDPQPSPAAWLGWWSDNGNPTARITQKESGLHLESEAFWPGPPTVRAKDWPDGWPHEGGANGPLVRSGNRAHFGDKNSGCQVDFTLVGGYLLAADNGECGGANVRLDGVYQRDPHAKFYAQ